MLIKNRLASLILLIFILTLIASNLYFLSIISRLQREVHLASNQASRALDVSSDLQSQVEGTSVMAGFALEYIADQLEILSTQNFTVMVPINQEIPVQSTIPFNEVFDVPINIVVPIDTTVTVPIQLGPLGTTEINVPIQTEVPVNTNIQAPIKKDVTINATVPIQLDVPITLSLEDTPLAQQLAEWRTFMLQLTQNSSE